MFCKILIAFFVKEANEKYQNEVEDVYQQARNQLRWKSCFISFIILTNKSEKNCREI